ncbi:MAG: DUF480 domain-containing protein, partial [Planctomycetota bacterium]
YPLTLNALTTGCNQKNNRAPVLNVAEERVLEALDSLRGKELVREVMLHGSRVEKFRHHAREVLQISTSELVVLAELLLRGPQTVGELRTRASRMNQLESLEAVEAILQSLGARDQPLAQKFPPAPGSRAPRFAQLLCPELHPIEEGPAVIAATHVEAPSPGKPAIADLSARVERLEAEVARMAQVLGSLLDKTE